MIHGRHVAVLVAVLFFGTRAGGVVAAMPEHPYRGIAERNVFNLKPPPDPESIKPPAPPAPKIILTGITTILGNKRALMKVPVPAKPPEPAREDSLILTEGQREHDVEVLAIDENAGIVKVNNHGVIQELSFEKDGPKLPGTSVASALPGISRIPPPPTIPPPTLVRPTQIPTRVPRTGVLPATPPGTPAAQPATPAPAGAATNVELPENLSPEAREALRLLQQESTRSPQGGAPAPQ